MGAMNWNAAYELFLDMLKISALSGVGILLILAVSPLLKKRHTVFWRYVLWVFLAIRLVFPFDISISEKAFVLPLLDGSPTTRQERSFSEAEEENSGVLPTSEGAGEDVSMGNAFARKEEPADPEKEETEERNPVSFSKEVRPKYSEIWMELVFKLLPYFWAAGVLAFLLWQLAGYGILRRKVKKTRVFLMEKEAVPVYVSEAVFSPMLMGIKTPQILLPCGAYEDEQLKFILEHEFAHLKRKDLWMKLLFALARTIHWFNPLVALLERRAVLDMEFLCDMRVVKDFTKEEKKKYSETLLACAASGNRTAFLCASEFSRDAKTLKERLTNIFSDKRRKKGVWAAGAGICILLSASLFLAFGPSKEESLTNGEDILHTEEADNARAADRTSKEDEARLNEMLSRLTGLSAEDAAAGIYGTVFPKLIYASDKRAVLYDAWGLIIYDVANQKIKQLLDLKAADFGYMQGDKATHIEVSDDGSRILFYNGPNSSERFIYEIENKKLSCSELDSFGESRYDGLMEREETNYAWTDTGKLAYLSKDSLIQENGDIFHEEDRLGLSLIMLEKDEGSASIYPLFSEVYEKSGEQAKTHITMDNLRIVVGKKYLHEDKEGWTYYLEEDEKNESPLQEFAGVTNPLLLTRYRNEERQVLENLIYQQTWFDCPVIFAGDRIVYKAAKTADTMSIKDPALVSIAMDGSDRRTADEIMYGVFDGICEDGGWLYYSGWTNDGAYPKPLCRIAPDFSGGPVLVEEIPGILCGVQDGMVYYLAAREQAVEKGCGIWKRSLSGGEEVIYDKWGVSAEDLLVFNVREQEDLMAVRGESKESGIRRPSGCQILFCFDYGEEIYSQLVQFEEKY